MSGLLKQSLFEMYREDPYVLDLLSQCDLSTIETNYLREVYARMPKDDVLFVQEILASDLVKQYDLACQCAVLAMTREITKLLEFVVTPQIGDSH